MFDFQAAQFSRTEYPAQCPSMPTQAHLAPNKPDSFMAVLQINHPETFLYGAVLTESQEQSHQEGFTVSLRERDQLIFHPPSSLCHLENN